MDLTFEWDYNKARENARKHGVTFEEARTVFFDPLAWTAEDISHSTIEDRFLTIGLSTRGRLLTVISTEYENTVRIISARRATPYEREQYEEGV
ncbi:MAG TPA: BrnT family toxin [Chloroflexia bacterium]|nr:BrnT family toxin [Chloroflexia bacterium]